jgi:voltage-gated potassium channel
MDSQNQIKVPVELSVPKKNIQSLEDCEDLKGEGKVSPVRASHLSEICKLSHRRGPLYWTAVLLSVISLGIIVAWIVSFRPDVPTTLIWLDIALGIFFAVEFFTRHGLRWNWVGYIETRFFDFIAIVPFLVLLYYKIPYDQIWLWIVLAARCFRVIDRLLGDGFIRRNVLALVEGLEEEITDRVLLRIISRIEIDLYRGSFSHGLAVALNRNRSSVLGRVREAHPREGFGASLAHITGLDTALERAEERTFDAIVKIIDSPEADQAFREAVDSAFVVMKKEIEVKSWRQRIGIQKKSYNF